MKRNYNTPKSLLLSVLVVFTCCYASLSAQPSTNICTGCGSGSYWPMTVGNSWAYEPQSGNSMLSESNGIYVISNTGAGGQFIDSAKVDGDNMYFKWSNNVTYQFGTATLYTSNTAWFMWIPAQPIQGQTWSQAIADNISVTTTVVSTNATANTGYCNYSNCLEITYNEIFTYQGATGTILWTNYYVMGIGLVYSTNSVNSGTATIFDLVSTQLYGCNTTGIDQVEEKHLTLNVYPNPVTNQLTLDCAAFGLQKPMVSVLDAMGKDVTVSSEYTNNRFELNTATLAPGIYLAMVRVNDKVLSQKFIKE